jgi:hypothetical protein
MEKSSITFVPQLLNNSSSVAVYTVCFLQGCKLQGFVANFVFDAVASNFLYSL